MNKSDYVQQESQKKGQDPNHQCHWPGCNTLVPPAMWGCKRHWFLLPKRIRDKIWKAYRPGQEITKTPSGTYLTVAREAQDWIRENYDIPKRRKR